MLYLFRKDSANNLNLNKQKKEEKDIRSDEYIQYLSLKNLKFIFLTYQTIKPIISSPGKTTISIPPKKIIFILSLCTSVFSIHRNKKTDMTVKD